MPRGRTLFNHEPVPLATPRDFGLLGSVLKFEDFLLVLGQPCVTLAVKPELIRGEADHRTNGVFEAGYRLRDVDV
jgi:hypothetical protein